MNEEEPENVEEIPVVETSEEPESESPPRKNAVIIISIAVVALALVASYLYLRNRSAETEEEKKEDVVVSVKVAKVGKGPIANEISAIGTASAAKQSTVAASISAQVTEMGTLKNALVQKGDVIAVLASKDLDAQRREAQAALDEAKLNLETLQKVTIPQTSAQTEKDLADAKAGADNARAVYERRKDLFAKGGISLKEVEASKLAFENAENNLRLIQKNARLNTSAVNPNSRSISEAKIRQAEDHLKNIEAQAGLAVIRSPITGVVTDQFQFQGEFASAGAKLVTIADISEIIVKAQFADSSIGGMKTGDEVTIYPNNVPDESISGRVTLISRSTDPTNRTVEVWANFANGRGLLRPGDSVKFVVAASPENEALTVPLSAVQFEASNSDEGTVMMVDANSIAHETKVKTGIKNGDKVQILDGLNEGDTIVVEGNYELPDGTKVEVAKEEEKPEE
ncbi:MAG TPA: efflux RND transporter periplasmic adaptor subunit [Pyrinomonadaceae bacterium]|nr:efflux RND transporter periplasmic adaptor subunit [Pyrinomonadaceae bacterium]